jgi:hypothetical protein
LKSNVLEELNVIPYPVAAKVRKTVSKQTAQNFDMETYNHK